MQKMNPVQAALLRKRSDQRSPLQVANGYRADRSPGPQVASPIPAATVKAAWLPTMSGQKVPMIGEWVDAEPDVDY